jgi:hypothetical protein
MATTGPNEQAPEFAFIAFDRSSGRAMAHGRRAIYALDGADRIGPNIEIEILATGRAGLWIWTDKIPLEEARSALDAMSAVIDWSGPLSCFPR